MHRCISFTPHAPSHSWSSSEEKNDRVGREERDREKREQVSKEILRRVKRHAREIQASNITLVPKGADGS